MAGINQKLKICSVCERECKLWISSPAMCKNCAMRAKNTLVQTESGKEATPFKAYRTAEIKKVSTRQQKLLAAYSAQRKVFLKNHPVCGIGHFGCSHVAVDIHHKRGHGEFFLNEDTWLQVCRSCHSFAELNPVWAKENGFSLSRLSKAI